MNDFLRAFFSRLRAFFSRTSLDHDLAMSLQPTSNSSPKKTSSAQ